MKAIYIDAFHGASGDMLLSSLLDYGLPISFLEDVIKRLGTNSIVLNMTNSTRKGVHGTHLDVIIDPSETTVYKWQDFVNIVNNSDFSNYLKNKTTDIFKLIGEAEAKVHNTNINEDDIIILPSTYQSPHIINPSMIIKEINKKEEK